MISLIELSLTNYRNIAHQVLAFNGDSKVVGENRIGKTNTIEALYWLLTDKLLNGSKDIEQIKPLKDTKAVVRVEAKFDVNGNTITLAKEYKEEWVKTRGTEDLVFKGHTTKYIYNGVPQGTKKEYDSLLSTDFGITSKDYQGIDTMQLLVNPLYLGRMGDNDDWKNLRTMIIDIVGDVKDDDVFAASPKFLVIKDDMTRLGGRTDQMVKCYRDEIKSIKESIIGYDANIQMLEKAEKPMDESIAIAKRGIQESEDKFRTLKVDNNDQVFLAIDQEIMDLKNQIIELKRQDLAAKESNPLDVERKSLLEEKEKLYNDAQELAEKRTQCIRDTFPQKSLIANLERTIDEEKANRLNMLDELHVVKSQLAHPEFEKECPHCHRPYDMEKIEEQLAEVTKSLQLKKDTIIIKGRENNESIQKHEEELASAQAKLEEMNTEILRIEDSVKVINSTLATINEKLSNLSLQPEKEFINPKIVELEQKIQIKEDEKASIRLDAQKKEDKVREIIADLQYRKEQYQKVLDDFKHWERCQEDIEKVKQEKKDLTTKLIQTEQKVELVKDFIKTKLEMLDENIKKVFEDVSFQLIEPQINGGYTTVCKPYIKGTTTLWRSGSKSEQVTTGVAICERIKAALGLPDLPFIFDEGGEISSDTFSTRFETKSQLICVQVKDGIMTPTVMNI